MTESWLKAEQVSQLTGWSDRHVRRTLKDASRESEARGRNGKCEREYALSALPAGAQLRYARGEAQPAAIEKASNVLPLFAKPEPAPVVTLPPELEDLAHARLAAIEPLLDFRRRTNGHRPTIALPGGRSVDTLNDLAEWIASQQKPAVSARTVYRWLDRFDKGGLAALGDAPRKDKGQSRYFSEHPLAAEFLRNKYLNECLSAQMCWEALCRDWRKTGESGAPPCYSTTVNFLNDTPRPLRTLARVGPEAYERKCSPYIKRAPVDAMEWWISDHRQFDVMVRNTLFAELKPDEAYRMWFTAILDWGSRKIVGFCVAPAPNWRTISSALRVAALGYGFPRNFYWDNGKDYAKVRRDLEAITLSEEAQSVLRREGIEPVSVTSALPFHPRSKPIEAHFTHWSKRFDVIWQQAYLGNKPGNRPEKARHAEALHQKYLQAKRAASPLPTDAEFTLALIQAIDEYNEKPHRSLQHRTPNEVMEEQYPERNRKPADARLLDVLFAERTLRTVRQGGCVQLDKMTYEPDDSSLMAMDLRATRGEKVVLLRDPYNLGEATAVEPETMRYIGSLHIQELVAQAPGGRITRDQIKASMRKQRALRRGYGEYLAALGAMAVHCGWRTEREELMARAMGGTGTDGAACLPARQARISHPAIPGARAQRQLPARTSRSVQPAFVSDAVAQDAEEFREIFAQED